MHLSLPPLPLQRTSLRKKRGEKRRHALHIVEKCGAFFKPISDKSIILAHSPKKSILVSIKQQSTNKTSIWCKEYCSFLLLLKCSGTSCLRRNLPVIFINFLRSTTYVTIVGSPHPQSFI